MDITVAICTWNRSKLLDATLQQMRKLRIPAGVRWELLVVNNRCTDDTDAVIARHGAHLPLRRLFEDKQGHSNARNCAVTNARGSLLIWTDDDVLVDEAWLEEYHRASVAYPNAVYFGGTVDPLFEADPPKWVREHPRLIEGPFALRQLGPEVRMLGKNEFPFGASLAFRLDRLRGLSFDPRLGRVGTGMLSGDETQVLEQLKADGAEGVWVGTARVRHHVPRDRMTMKYVWRFFAGLGATEVRRSGLPPGKYVFNMPRWMIREYCQFRMKLLLARLRMDQQWAAMFRQTAYTWGILREAAAQRAAAAGRGN